MNRDIKALVAKARTGDSLAIQELLEIADESISCLGWLATNKREHCAPHAKERTTWPAFVSTIKDIEDRWQQVKCALPLERWRSKKYDAMFKCARAAHRRLSDPHETWHGLYFAGTIKGVEWMPSAERCEAIKKFQQCAMIGKNWDKWKPVFGRFLTFNFGPAHEVWKLFPKSTMPPQLRETGNPVKSWRENIVAAQTWGVVNQWMEHMINTKQIKPTDRGEILKEISSLKSRKNICIMELSGDDSLNNAKGRSKNRNSGWSEYKTELLKRCKRLMG